MSEHLIIVRCDLGSEVGGVKVDIGTLSPFVAALVLEQAADACAAVGDPLVAVIHNDAEIMSTIGIGDDDDE
jgi:hypothetical protein